MRRLAANKIPNFLHIHSGGFIVFQGEPWWQELRELSGCMRRSSSVKLTAASQYFCNKSHVRAESLLLSQLSFFLTDNFCHLRLYKQDSLNRLTATLWLIK